MLVQATFSILAPNRSNQNGVSELDPSIDSNTHYKRNSKLVPTLRDTDRYVVFREKLTVSGNNVCSRASYTTMIIALRGMDQRAVCRIPRSKERRQDGTTRLERVTDILFMSFGPGKLITVNFRTPSVAHDGCCG